MATLRAWFYDIEARTGETPTHYTLGGNEWGYNSELWPAQYGAWPPPDSILDTEFDSGYGGECGPAINAWSPSWVIIKATYDGSEWLTTVPRHPSADAPSSVGG